MSTQCNKLVENLTPSCLKVQLQFNFPAVSCLRRIMYSQMPPEGPWSDEKQLPMWGAESQVTCLVSPSVATTNEGQPHHECKHIHSNN